MPPKIKDGILWTETGNDEASREREQSNLGAIVTALERFPKSTVCNIFSFVDGYERSITENWQRVDIEEELLWLALE